MLPGDRLVCAFVEPVEVNEGFKDWPLHVTIVPWFRLEESSAVLADDFKTVLAGIGAFDARVADSAAFGHRGRKLASLLQDPAPFIQIEKLVRAALRQKHAWLVDETTKRQRQYRPHVTFQNSGHLNNGDSFHCGSLYIVEQLGVQKQTVNRVQLGHEQQTEA